MHNVRETAQDRKTDSKRERERTTKESERNTKTHCTQSVCVHYERVKNERSHKIDSIGT